MDNQEFSKDDGEINAVFNLIGEDNLKEGIEAYSRERNINNLNIFDEGLNLKNNNYTNLDRIVDIPKNYLNVPDEPRIFKKSFNERDFIEKQSLTKDSLDNGLVNI
jgi:hypothetical protein